MISNDYDQTLALYYVPRTSTEVSLDSVQPGDVQWDFIPWSSCNHPTTFVLDLQGARGITRRPYLVRCGGLRKLLAFHKIHSLDDAPKIEPESMAAP